MIPFAILTIESDSDRAFMTLLYQRHRALMLKTAWEFTREPAVVEEIVSESCVALINHLDTLRTLEKEHLRGYIAVTVRNKALDHCKRMQRHYAKCMPTDEDYVSRMPDPDCIEKKVLLLDELRRVWELLHTLPQREQEILRLKYHDGLKHKEIAAILGITESTVTTHLLRARDRLKAALY